MLLNLPVEPLHKVDEIRLALESVCLRELREQNLLLFHLLIYFVTASNGPIILLI